MKKLYDSIRFVVSLVISLGASTSLHLALEYAGLFITLMMFGKLCPAWAMLLGGFYIPYAVSGMVVGTTRGIRLPLLTAPCGAALAHALFHRLQDNWVGTLQDRHYLPMILVSALGSLLGVSLLRAFRTFLPDGMNESSSAAVRAEG